MLVCYDLPMVQGRQPWCGSRCGSNHPHTQHPYSEGRVSMVIRPLVPIDRYIEGCRKR